jgi:hypothetical protein
MKNHGLVANVFELMLGYDESSSSDRLRPTTRARNQALNQSGTERPLSELIQ